MKRRRTPKYSVRRLAIAALTLGLLLSGCMANSGEATTTISGTATLLMTIGVHVEPHGSAVSSIVGGPGAGSGPRSGKSYLNRGFFDGHVHYLRGLARLMKAHAGKLTVQVQTPFTIAADQFNDAILSDLEDDGHEIGLHFHEDAHLGPNSGSLSADQWCDVMGEEIRYIHAAGVNADVRYWSGGNFYEDVLQAGHCAVMDVTSDFKNPKTQETDEAAIGVHPWRPAGGPQPIPGSDEVDLEAFATHDPNGPVVFLPLGIIDPETFARKKEIKKQGDRAWFRVLGQSLTDSLAEARPDRVNVFHFTIHPQEFSLQAIDRFLTNVVDPLVAAGQVEWATFSEQADAFIRWEEENPDVDPR